MFLFHQDPGIARTSCAVTAMRSTLVRIHSMRCNRSSEQPVALSPANLFNYLFPGFVVEYLQRPLASFLFSRVRRARGTREFRPPRFSPLVYVIQQTSIIIGRDSLSNLFAVKVNFWLVDPLPLLIIRYNTNEWFLIFFSLEFVYRFFRKIKVLNKLDRKRSWYRRYNNSFASTVG